MLFVQMTNARSGFTLIETLISLIIAIIIVLSYLSFFINSQLLLKRANERLELLQLAENKLNDLQSSSFLSSTLRNGMHCEESSGGEKIFWEVNTISAELKEVTLQVVNKMQQIKIKFYKSYFVGGNSE